ncbi:alpha/beta hydrolase [Leptospira inadai]|uniref:alpha/beta hydrolase n=1 Tax=Leptospira inadai TaxID=29506 RepID=UPI001EE1CFDC|nr:alpha/beta hydrolase [Leptospira inadai]
MEWHPRNASVLLVHGGGGDRREVTKYIRFFLNRKFDVLTFDLSCHGEANCPVPGLTYGNRESRDVLGAYRYLTDRYSKVYAMGSSVGAASILIAMPDMPKLSAVIAENPIFNFQRLIIESPAAPGFLPNWFKNLLVQLTMLRGRFDGLLSPANSIRLVKSVPIYFIQSKADTVNPFRHTQELAELYAGPKTLWFPEIGSHGAIWDVDSVEYEKRLQDFLKGVR